ncbi:MAG: penicillin-binding protein activator [Rhodovarius sp.]|nr:penicillin-binding protein activator [Rhodovarius sp.]
MARSRVGLLLPLSGANAALGHAMLNAAQLALFDQQDPRVEFLPRDTRSSGAGAAEAAREVLAEGASVLVGPLTLAETQAAAQLARGAGVPMLAFTTDETLAGNGVWTLGLGPLQAGRRLAELARNAGARRIALLVPEGEFGRRLAAGLRAGLAAPGQPAPLLVRSIRNDPAEALREIAQLAAGPEGPDTLIIGAEGALARQIAQALPAAGFTRPIRLIGNHLWAGDATLLAEPALAGALFPGPDPEARAPFDARYREAFGEEPARLAGTAYDAAALAARAARAGGRALPVGEAFQGADGPIRLDAQGLLARGLAIFRIEGGRAVLVEPAPLPGLTGS